MSCSLAQAAHFAIALGVSCTCSVSCGRLLHGVILCNFMQHYLTMLGATVLIPTLLVPAMGGNDDDKAQTIQRCVQEAGLTVFLWNVCCAHVQPEHIVSTTLPAANCVAPSLCFCNDWQTE